MVEEIGRIKLDYSKYPGEDLYCDGAVEDELLEIVKEMSVVEYAGVIEERKSWPILYHLSPLRENIVDWIPMKPTDRVLEVGSGCGAITGALARKAGSVTCVELSKKRSLINAYRHSDNDNVVIHVGNFKDIEPDLPRDFDYICLIGVFEYGQGYIGGERPYEEFLEILIKHLAPGGRIVIAIENKYGLKYFAGCMEDHLGKYFNGIEDYPDGGVVRTFSRKGLERVFQSCDINEYSFYYPYPDYKFMTTLYSDKYLPGKGELFNNIRNFDGDRMLLFDEKHAFDGIVRDGLFPVFANSYVVVLGEDFQLDYVKYSNDRAPEYQIKTVISKNQKGETFVRKYPMTSAAREHVRGMALAFKLLSERYEGSSLRINPCELVEQGEELYARFPFEKGRPLSELMDQCLDRNDVETYQKLFDAYVERIGYNGEAGVADFDLVFSNLLVDGDTWTLIDYEWTFGRPVETKELAFRAIYCYLLEDEKRNRLELDRILEKLKLTGQDAENYRRREMEFQQFVTGKRQSMTQLRDKVGGEILIPEKWIHKFKEMEGVARIQIYRDTGNGYREEESEFLQDVWQSEQLVEFTLPVSGDVRMLRIDPGMEPCICKLLELTFNGLPVPVDKKGIVAVNGKTVNSARDKSGKTFPSYLFPTADPNISINLSALHPQGKNTLFARFQVVRLPHAMAEDIAGAVKRRF